MEFQKAKEKVLGEEPNLSRMACLAAAVNQVYGIPGQEMTRGEGAESARVFGMWTDLEAILVGRFCPLRHTVLRKSLKRGSQKGTNRRITAITAITVLF